MIRHFSRVLALMTVLTLGLVAAQADAANFTFKRVGTHKYQFQVNGTTAQTLNYAGNENIQFDLTFARLRSLGVKGGPLVEAANADLGNNVYEFARRGILRFVVNEDFASGSIIKPPPVPRPVFDFQRTRTQEFRLIINGKRARWVDFRKTDQKTIRITRADLINRFGVNKLNLTSIIDREFGNKWRQVGNAFELDVTFARAGGSGDNLFFFDQVRQNHFRLYINGRKSNWFDLKKNFTSGDPFFVISQEVLAARYGLVGDIAQIFRNQSLNGIRVQQLANGSFKFSVDRGLFNSGGTRTVDDSTFIVRRTVASVS